MSKTVIGTFAAVIAVVAIARITAVPAAETAQARAAAPQPSATQPLGAEPAVDPAAAMRKAPADLPVERWNPI